MSYLWWKNDRMKKGYFENFWDGVHLEEEEEEEETEDFEIRGCRK